MSSRFTQPKKYSRAAFLPTYTWDRIKSGSVGKHQQRIPFIQHNEDISYIHIQTKGMRMEETSGAIRSTFVNMLGDEQHSLSKLHPLT